MELRQGRLTLGNDCHSVELEAPWLLSLDGWTLGSSHRRSNGDFQGGEGGKVTGKLDGRGEKPFRPRPNRTPHDHVRIAREPRVLGEPEDLLACWPGKPAPWVSTGMMRESFWGRI